ncbi:MAG: diacylglycerol/lipid kinase family protein [Anaerolineae bacterium]
MSIGSESKRVQRATLIYNPLAGPSNWAGPIELVADYWRARRWDVTIRPTRVPGHATTLAAEAAAAGHALVIAAGGDGTLGEVANGLAGTEVVLAPLPAGTGNSFAKELHILRAGRFGAFRLLDATEALVAGRVQRIDLGRTLVDGQPGPYWLLWAGAGADGYLVQQMEPRPKWSKKLGTLGYILQALTLFPQMPPMKVSVTVDGRRYDDHCLLVVVTNCRRYAGGLLELNPQGLLDDGRFEVWMFRGQGVKETAHHFLQVKLGRHLADDRIVMVSGREVRVETDPVLPCQSDGDDAGTTPLHCVVEPLALRVLIPATAPVDIFALPGEAFPL